MKMSEFTDKLFPALFAAKKQMGPVVKGGYNPHFKSGFANLNDHLELIEPILESHGLMVMQPPTSDANGLTSVTTLLIHAESGQWISSELPLTSTPDMQKTLAAITYARRGALNAFFSLRAIDDDGETVVGRGKPQSFSAPAKVATKPLTTPAPAAKVEEVETKKAAPAPFTRAQAKPEKQPAQSSEVSSKPAANKGVW